MSYMLINPKKYAHYPMFSYKEFYGAIDELTEIIEIIMDAKKAVGEDFTVGDLLDAKEIVTEYLSYSMNAKLNCLWNAEEYTMYPDDKQKMKRQNNNPYVRGIKTNYTPDGQLDSFRKANEWARDLNGTLRNNRLKNRKEQKNA